MAKFKESAAKQTVRDLLLDACKRLQRSGLTYLGVPAEDARDIKTLAPLLKHVICVDASAAVLEETKRSIAELALKTRKVINAELWAYLRDQYPSERLVADITFLDFYGGGIQKQDPYAQEIAGIRSYFAKHASIANKAFVFAWTYNPRDRGTDAYLQALEKIIPKHELKPLREKTGFAFRHLAIRMLLLQSLREHGMFVKVFQHAVYKNVMSTLIIVFSKGQDATSAFRLKDADSIIDEPVVFYDPEQATPRLGRLMP